MDRVALVGQLFVAYQTGEFGQLAELMAPDVRLEPLSTDLERGPVYEGIAGVAEWARELAASEEEFQPAIESIEERGERVLAIGSIQMAAESGLTRASAAWVFDFDAQGRLRRMRAYRDVDEARAAAEAL
jgi:ketosteroid isomerase-like protein